MSNFLAIAPQYTDIEIGDVKIRNYGWSAADLAILLSNHGKEIRDIVASVRESFQDGAGFVDVLTSLDPEVFATVSQFVIPEAIALSTRQPRDDVDQLFAIMDRIREVPITTQLLFLKDAYDHTFPKGVADFLTALGLTAEA